MDFFDFLLWAVALGVCLEAWRLYLRHLQKGGRPVLDGAALFGGGSAAGEGPDDGSGDEGRSDLRRELADLRERVQVLEAIVTDRGADLSRQIDDLERRV